MKSALFAIGVTLALVERVVAWGDVGHEAVGYVAMEFLGTKAAAFVKKTVPSSYNYSLGPCATWADTFKYETGNAWSKALHFIDANDDPLGGSCSVVESRDCGSAGCLSTAIANYTSRVTDSSLSATQIEQALYFITHFIGDIGQPLHVENYEYGGNDIDTVCAGEATELHATWDTGMIVQMVSQNYSGSTTAWADALVADIKTGTYKSDAAAWISCSSVTEPLSRRRTIEDDVRTVLAANTTTPLACPMVWAQESNAYDCSNVFDYTTGDDLCTGAYFKASIPIINLQIAKQGYRLAAWLNVIFDGSVSLP
ncbi:nuclease Le1 [Athelia psychrophila]|uniref:Nuclease Le1 n=1 Tax=Athelia psychrophila TaxID=1759441 RepID=A0A166LC66_9AGAM|nr:nuclease Le1 [Fibularhizoctonia sp. CBS 109695]